MNKIKCWLSKCAFSILENMTAKTDENWFILHWIDLHPIAGSSETADVLLLLRGNSCKHDLATFEKLIDLSSEMRKDNTFDEFQVKVASRGICFTKRLSEEAENYLLLRAYRRGKSLRICRKKRKQLTRGIANWGKISSLFMQLSDKNISI